MRLVNANFLIILEDVRRVDRTRCHTAIHTAVRCDTLEVVRLAAPNLILVSLDLVSLDNGGGRLVLHFEKLGRLTRSAVNRGHHLRSLVVACEIWVLNRWGQRSLHLLKTSVDWTGLCRCLACHLLRRLHLRLQIFMYM